MASESERDAEPPREHHEYNFEGRVAIITGAGGGLGRAYAKLLGSRGAKLVINDVDTGSAAATVEAVREVGGEAVVDFNSVVDGKRIVQTAIDTFGRVDILINNAGTLRDKSFRNMEDVDWDAVYQVHLQGTFAVTHAAWKHMEKSEYGRIVNASSPSGIYGWNAQANYVAMTSSIIGFTQALAIEGARKNIKVNVVAPVAFTRLTEEVLTEEQRRELPVAEAANFVAYLCHESCDSTSGVFELGGRWIARSRWQRSPGVVFPKSGFKVEDVAARFREVMDFSGGGEHPKDGSTGMAKALTHAGKDSKL